MYSLFSGDFDTTGTHSQHYFYLFSHSIDTDNRSSSGSQTGLPPPLPQKQAYADYSNNDLYVSSSPAKRAQSMPPQVHTQSHRDKVSNADM